jgi:hypothetical protein
MAFRYLPRFFRGNDPVTLKSVKSGSPLGVDPTISLGEPTSHFSRFTFHLALASATSPVSVGASTLPRC